MKEQNNSALLAAEAAERKGVSRRRFLGYAGALASVGMIGLQSCNSDDNNNTTTGTGINLGSGDVGVLNYAYALEQLEAAFYAQVLVTPYTGMSEAEKSLLTDIRDHEGAHREFFKQAITAAAATQIIPGLTPNFSTIDFSNRDVVLATARTFEDLGVAAYNGAGKLITTPAYLTIAGKIVSVEARHAALIRDLISNGSFADLSSIGAFHADNTNGLDGAMTPTEVLAQAGKYIKEKLNAANLPTS
jgi:hypothetical protein